ncbi:MAG: zf-HC2 domain-containing protein [bacterium]|nr:zf-HC2 domain-containing protein [bacterium]
MSRCSKIRTWIGPYADGELSAVNTAQVREHVASCEGCRGELHKVTAMGRLIREGFEAALQQEGTDLDLLRQRIRLEAEKIPRPLRRPVSWTPGFRGRRVLASLAAVVALVLSVTFTIYKSPEPVLKTALSNECIVDSVDGGDRTVILYKTHASKMTVIWVAASQDA